jgi:hypothetical protein
MELPVIQVYQGSVGIPDQVLVAGVGIQVSMGYQVTAVKMGFQVIPV